ncbi:MAG: choice-of-anchor J domain-containing protein, partial [Candidatus Symbiothrix sp.]|nr:choice-of-anchor J domain-containing protein [Candidatus Symbiothrix sp.]
MKKWITLLLILLIFSPVNGQDVFRFGEQEVDNSAAKSAKIPRTREEVAAFNGTPHRQSAPVLRSTTEVNTLLSEGFEGLAIGAIPAGWTRIAKAGASGEQIWGASRWNPHNDDDSGNLRSMRILYGPTTHDDWIITPALPLESGKSYTITYWLQFAGWEENGVQFFE